MITPADMARMMAKASGKRTQNSSEGAFVQHADIEPDTLLYTAQSHGETPHGLDDETLCNLENMLKEQQADVHEAVTGTGKPTPALMAHIHQGGAPATFASLDAQELPAVREYSAGGLVFDDRQRVAIIGRHSRSGHLEWCLPKGHIEKGETPEETAVREIHEETGILGEVMSSIATTDYWFTGTGERIHKLVHHFALRQIGGFLTVEGDPDHEAEDTKWVDFDDLDKVLSYPNERKIVWLYARKMNR